MSTIKDQQSQVFTRAYIDRIPLSGGAKETIRITNIPGGVWDPSGIFHPLLINGWSGSYYVSSDLSVVNSTPSRDEYTLFARDEQGADSEFIIGDIDDYIYDGQSVTVEVGGQFVDSEERAPWVKVFSGVMRTPTTDRRGMKAFRVLSNVWDEDRPVIDDLYTGYGEMITFVGPPSIAIAPISDPAYQTIEPVIKIRGRMVGESATFYSLIRARRDYGLAVTPGRTLAFQQYDTGTASLVFTESVEIPDGDFVAMCRVSDGNLRMWLGNGKNAPEMVLDQPLPLPITIQPAPDLQMNQIGPGHTWSAYEAAIGDASQITEDQLLSEANFPESNPDIWIDLFRMRESIVGQTVGANETATFSLSGGAFFDYTDTGDAPDLGSQITGTRVQDGYGLIRNAQPVPLHMNIARFHLGKTVTKLLSVSSRCAPIPCSKTFTVSSIGDIEVIAPNKVQILPSIGDLHPLFQSQSDPFVAGQRVEIVNSGTSNGQYTIKSISDDGMTAELSAENPLVDPDPVLASETLPIGASFGSTDSLVEADYDLNGFYGATLTFRDTVNVPTDVRFDAIMNPLDDYAAIAADIGFTVIDNRILKPKVGILFRSAITRGSGGSGYETLGDMLSAMDTSSVGYHYYNEEGTLILGSHLDPRTEDSKVSAVAIDSVIFDVFPEGSTVPDVPILSIASVEEIESIDPYSEFYLMHSRNWSPVSESTIVGSASSEDRTYCSNDYKRIRRVNGDPSASNRILDSIETLITDPADAIAAAERLKGLLFYGIRRFSISIAGLSSVDIEKGTYLMVQYNNRDLPFSTVRKVGVLGGSYSTDSAASQVNAYLPGKGN